MASLSRSAPARLRALLRRAWRHTAGADLDRRVEHGLEVIDRLGVRVLIPGAPGYPPVLRHLHDPPPILFARGRLELLERPVLGIVGTRRCTREGREFTHEIASAVVQAGGVVVSGLALGIDGAAHEGALPETVAVLGAGLDVAQPPSHRALQERIGEEGLLITEYPPGSEALPFHFPERNRIIAALSKALLVVEAPARSGALITAEHATDMGIDILAVPGPPRRVTSAGTNELLRDGAAIVTEPRDVLDALGLTPRRHPDADARGRPGARNDAKEEPEEPAGIDHDALSLWRAAVEPLHIDELTQRTGLAAASSLRALLELEILGLIARLPGQRYQRR